MTQPQRICVLPLACLAVAAWTACSRAPSSPTSAPPGEPVTETAAARGSSTDGVAAGVIELTPEAVQRFGIRTVTVEERVLGEEIETTGAVDFDQNRIARVNPRVEGRVASAPAQLGERVGAGQVLAQIDSIELGQARAEYLQGKAREELAAQAAFREASAAFKSAEEVLHLFGLSEREIDTLRYEDPRASIYHVRAPFAGKIVEKHTTVGELVSPESKLFVLADHDDVEVRVDAALGGDRRLRGGNRHLLGPPARGRARERGARSERDMLRRELIEGQREYVEAAVEAWVARVDLELATGVITLLDEERER